MSIEVRSTPRNRLRSAAEVITVALMGPLPTDEVWERRRAGWEAMESISAWDGERCVGHAGQFHVDTVVPGGRRLAAGAVTRVAVLPTHRRRGVASRLMEQLIADSVDQDLALMMLWASETGIYRRFGFGHAADHANLQIAVSGAAPLRRDDVGGSFVLLSPDEVLDTVPAVYDTAALRRAGGITRPNETWWRRQFDSVLDRSKAEYVVVHLDRDGRADGYVHYGATWNDDEPDEAPTGSGTVLDLFGADDRVELALWQYLFDVDLVTRWRANGRPTDDPVRRAAGDGRAVRVRAVDDALWLRLVDIDAALTARSYRDVRGSVAIGVSDSLVERNNRTWRVSSDGVEVTNDPPDVALEGATLSALYLGGVSWSTLAATGDVAVNDTAALAAADALFSVDRAPFCGTFF
ncbi:GNAT family N-acetyltransferase [Ilumatobacter sp.]|uniref:GNAT family N-acetyltransferase n=1 Tax=Ilumatobacter sp. TaxID=1967498 RepID=UPI003AF82485